MKDPISDFYQNFAALSHELDEQYVQLKTDLDKWHFDMIERIENMHLNVSIDLDTSYERLDRFRQTLHILLDEEHLIDKTGSRK